MAHGMEGGSTITISKAGGGAARVAFPAVILLNSLENRGTPREKQRGKEKSNDTLRKGIGSLSNWKLRRH